MEYFALENPSKVTCIVNDYSCNLKENHTPLVIDNGSYHCRVGWAGLLMPELDFKNVIAKNRGNRKEKDWEMLVADEITNIEAVRWLLRTPHDFNVLVNYSIQETLFDYVFKHLGIDSDGEIGHPVLITEPIANPAFCRKNMSELLFEAYSIPQLAYGIDCLFSEFNNENEVPLTSLIISSGFQSTHILPVVMGFPDVKNALRLNLGGYNCAAYMQRLLQLKNPVLASELNLTRMENVVRNLCYIPQDYNEEIKQWLDPFYSINNTTSLVIPYQENVKINSSKVTPSFCRTIELQKKLKRFDFKLHEVNCVLDIENVNPDAAVKVAKDFGCDSMEQLKEKSQDLYSSIQELQKELNDQIVDPNAAKKVVKCGTEKIQIPEILFQPSLVGFDQCGLKECIEIVLKRYSSEIQNSLAKHVFITGGTSCIKGFRQRVFTDLQELRPYKSEINVIQAADSSLDAWKGAAKWALTDHNAWVTRQEFEEHGWDFFHKHRFSNS